MGIHFTSMASTSNAKGCYYKLPCRMKNLEPMTPPPKNPLVDSRLVYYRTGSLAKSQCATFTQHTEPSPIVRVCTLLRIQVRLAKTGAWQAKPQGGSTTNQG